MTLPKYTYSKLIAHISTAGLEEIKEILSTVTSEQELYESSTFTEILLLINKRVNDLINSFYSKPFHSLQL